MAIKLTLLCLVAAIAIHSSAGAEFWDDLRVKYDLNALKGFHRIARTFLQAINGGGFEPVWPLSCETKTDNGYFYGNRVTNPADQVFSPLYDNNGVIAGVQAWWPKDEILSSPENKVRYYNVPMYQNATFEGKQYFVVTAYFVEPETICNEGRTEGDLNTEGTGRGLWFQAGPTPADSIEVPKLRSAAIAQNWTKNACFPGMGAHNFYAVDTYDETKCLETGAAFILYGKSEEMLGFGFHIQGFANSTNYVEHPPNLAISAILGAPVPQCVLDQNDLLQTTTLHVYFVNNPWLINCL